MPFTKSEKPRIRVPSATRALQQPLLCRNMLAVHPWRNKGMPHALQRVQMSEKSRHSLSHPEFSPDCMVLIVTGWVGPVLRRVKPVKQQLTHLLLFPQEFRLFERDRMGTSGCLCLNHMERLLSRSPGSPGILLNGFNNHLTCHVSRCSRTHLASDSG